MYIFYKLYIHLYTITVSRRTINHHYRQKLKPLYCEPIQQQPSDLLYPMLLFERHM